MYIYIYVLDFRVFFFQKKKKKLKYSDVCLKSFLIIWFYFLYGRLTILSKHSFFYFLTLFIYMHIWLSDL